MPQAQRNGHDRRRRLIEAATVLFEQAPYDRVQVENIASAAHVAKPTVYRYFANKEALFLAALERGLAVLVEEIRAIAARDEASTARLKAVVAVMLRGVSHYKTVLRAVEPQSTGIQARGRKMLRERLRALQSTIATIIEDGIARGEFRECDAALATNVILGGVRYAAERSQQARAADMLADMFIGGLAAIGRQPARQIGIGSQLS